MEIKSVKSSNPSFQKFFGMNSKDFSQEQKNIAAGIIDKMRNTRNHSGEIWSRALGERRPDIRFIPGNDSNSVTLLNGRMSKSDSQLKDTLEIGQYSKDQVFNPTDITKARKKSTIQELARLAILSLAAASALLGVSHCNNKRAAAENLNNIKEKVINPADSMTLVVNEHFMRKMPIK